MFARYLFLCCFFFFHLYADSGSITTNPTQITPYSDQAYYITSCYNSKANQVIFSWRDSSDYPYGTPYYSIYDIKSGVFTTIPTQIDPTGYTQKVASTVFCCYNSASNQVVFSWNDSSHTYAWYAIYNVTSSSFTTNPTPINQNGYSSGVNEDVMCCYNSTSNQIVFSWTDNSQNYPWYAIYDVKSGSIITAPTQINQNGYTSGVNDDVACCYNSTSNQIVFSWTDNSQAYPWYAIYDVKSSSITTSPTPINKDNYNDGVNNDVFCCYNSALNQIVFSWNDNSAIYPWYAIYDVKSESFSTTPTIIPDYSSSNGVAIDVICCYNSITNEVFFSWTDGLLNFAKYGIRPWYAIYDADSKNFTTTPTPIDPSGYSSGVNNNVFCCYSNVSNQVFFSWVSQPTQKPYYAIYTEMVPASVAQKRLLRAVNLYNPPKIQKGIIP